MPELTAAQRVRANELALVLRAVKKLDVWQEANGCSFLTFRELLGVSDPVGDVTEEMHLAEVAGLARLVPLPQGPGAIWELTPVGEVALAEHEKEKGRNDLPDF